MLAVRLPDDIDKRLEILAKKTGRPKSFYAKMAIETRLPIMEEYYLNYSSALGNKKVVDKGSV